MSLSQDEISKKAKIMAIENPNWEMDGISVVDRGRIEAAAEVIRRSIAAANRRRNRGGAKKTKKRLRKKKKDNKYFSICNCVCLCCMRYSLLITSFTCTFIGCLQCLNWHIGTTLKV